MEEVKKEMGVEEKPEEKVEEVKEKPEEKAEEVKEEVKKVVSVAPMLDVTTTCVLW